MPPPDGRPATRQDIPQSTTAAVPSPPAWTDERVEIVVGRLLQIGVTLAAAVVLLGGVIYLAHDGRDPAHYRIFKGEREDLRSVTGVIHDLLIPRWRAVIQLGLLLLIATPVARVVFSVFAFALEHDYLYVIITLIVLSILVFSLFGHYG